MFGREAASRSPPFSPSFLLAPISCLLSADGRLRSPRAALSEAPAHPRSHACTKVPPRLFLFLPPLFFSGSPAAAGLGAAARTLRACASPAAISPASSERWRRLVPAPAPASPRRQPRSRTSPAPAPAASPDSRFASPTPSSLCRRAGAIRGMRGGTPEGAGRGWLWRGAGGARHPGLAVGWGVRRGGGRRGNARGCTQINRHG